MERIAKAELACMSGTHRLISGDCLTVLPTLDSGTVDVVVTSPPYNLGLSYRGYDDRRAEDEYLDWLTQRLVKMDQVLRPIVKALP